MTDQEMKSKIQAAVSALNAALREAVNAGFTVQVSDTYHRSFGTPETQQFSVEVSRVERI
jgi:hypothetical protein